MPVIAELCQNHNGDLEILREMVYKSAEAGAQFCKIQTFFADDLTQEWIALDYDRLKKLELDWNAHKEFVKWCKRDGIIPMTSVYTTRYAQQLSDIGFKWIKIGSAQCADIDLIKTYKAIGFKVVVSTGGHRLQDVPKLGPIEAVLHCVSKYPFSPDEADLIRMIELKRFWPNTPIGFSDHSDPMHAQWDMAAKVALAIGGTWLERHVTILPRNATKDGPVSITMEQLKELCRWEKLPQEDKIKERPTLGLLNCAKTLPELDLVKRYKNRWKT